MTSSSARHFFALTIASGLLAGCAHLPPESFSQREGAVEWRRDKEADAAALVRAQELLAGNLDADRAAQIALLASPDLQAQFERLGIARASWLAAAAAPNPVVDWQRRSLTDGGGTKVEWGLTENILNLLTLPQRRAAATAELDAARFETALHVEHLALEARAAVLSVQATDRIAELRRQHADLGRLAFEVAGRYRDAGNIKALDFEEERTRALEARSAYDAAALAALEARLVLVRILGVPGREGSLQVSGRLAPLPANDPAVADLERVALDVRLDLRALRRRAEAALHRVGVARNTRLVPALEVGASREIETGGDRLRGASATLELPLFDARTAEVAAGDAEARLALRELEGRMLDVHRELRLAEASLATARRRAETWEREVLPARRKIVDSNAREFFYMLRGPFDPMHAQQAALEAEIESVAALRDYWLARVQLARTSGELALAKADETAKDKSP